MTLAPKLKRALENDRTLERALKAGVIRATAAGVIERRGPTGRYRPVPFFENKSGARRFVIHGGKFLVHRAVAIAFHGRRRTYLDVDARNGNRSDTRPGNLIYRTRSGNALEEVRNGRRPVGERVATSKLTPARVAKIRRVRPVAGSADERALANEFKVGVTTIRAARYRVSWRT